MGGDTGMSKYYKAKDIFQVIDKIIQNATETDFVTEINKLPTIEVNEEATRPFEYFEGYEDGRKSIEIPKERASDE